MATARLYSSIYPAPPLHPALRSSLRYVLAEGRALAVRLIAYLGALAAMAAMAAHLYAAIPPVGDSVELRTGDKWAAATRPTPAFDLPAADLIGKSVAYDISRHPEGGRRDTFRWSAESDGKPLAELEIYRRGGESEALPTPAATLARLASLGDPNSPQPAGMIDSKFGPVPLLSFQRDRQTCLGFVKAFDTARLQLGGWSCNGASLVAQRSLAACALDRLTMLSAGNDPKLAELFAQAELRRGKCAEAGSNTNDWMTASSGPQLRGMPNNN